ncbi:MAG: hypothetical protein PHU44_05510 [Syntrophales bacterium]|nr:hypothetical protein [Syntrophales bacterium]MDD5641626.1 hypothetical protein [Syntrophales bacterium]
MSADVKEKAVGALQILWVYSRMFAINTLRRAVILGRYTLICWQQQRLRCAQRRVGRAVLKALEEGEVNPMLTESVKDALAKAGAVRGRKEKQYQAIADIREKIRTSCTCARPAEAEESPPVQEAPPAAEPEPAQESPPGEEPRSPEGGPSGASGQ